MLCKVFFGQINLLAGNVKEAESLLQDYRNRIPVKDFNGLETISAVKHILCTRCNEVGFIVCGDKIEIAGEKGNYTEEEIEPLSRKWWVAIPCRCSRGVYS
jgi:hypothetical protein